MKITRIAMMTTILVAQEFALSPFPNIQLTFLLVILLSRYENNRSNFATIPLVIVSYSVIDSLLLGGFGPWTLTVMSGWLMVAIIYRLFKTENIYAMALLSIPAVFIWATPNMLYSHFVFETPLWVYFMADLPFNIVLITSSSISIILLYERLRRLLWKEEWK